MERNKVLESDLNTRAAKAAALPEWSRKSIKKRKVKENKQNA